MHHDHRLTTHIVGHYVTSLGDERTLILVDLSSHGGLWTLLDVIANEPLLGADTRVVKRDLWNFADSGDTADAYAALSTDLGRPAVDAV